MVYSGHLRHNFLLNFGLKNVCVQMAFQKKILRIRFWVHSPRESRGHSASENEGEPDDGGKFRNLS